MEHGGSGGGNNGRARSGSSAPKPPASGSRAEKVFEAIQRLSSNSARDRGSEDIEKIVLGSILLNNNVWPDCWAVWSRLGAQWQAIFAMEPHRKIASAVKAVFDQHGVCDLTLLHAEMTRQGSVEFCGGWMYLAELEQAVLASGAAAALSEELLLCAAKRRMAWLIERMLLGSTDKSGKVLRPSLDSAGVDEFFAACVDMQEQIANTRQIVKTQHVKTMEDAVDAAMLAHRNAIQRRERMGGRSLFTCTDLRLPHPTIQANIGGFMAGDMMTLLGVTNHGKTGLALQWMRSWAKQIVEKTESGEIPKDGAQPIILYITSEENLERTGATMLQSALGISSRRILSGELIGSDVRMMDESGPIQQQIKRLPIRLDEMRDPKTGASRFLTPGILQGMIEGLLREHLRPVVVVVDNTESIKPDFAMGQKTDDWRAHGDLPQHFKQIAVQYELGMLILGQQIQHEKKDDPTVRGNKAWFLRSDTVLKVWNHGAVNPDAYTAQQPVNVDVLFLKERGGSSRKTVPLLLDRTSRVFVEDAQALKAKAEREAERARRARKDIDDY